MNNILSVGFYNQHKQLCHGVKNGNERAIHDAATMLASITPADAVLIPLPSHYGRATYMLDIAQQVAKIKGCEVDPCIASAERIRLYDAKKMGKTLELGFKLTHRPCGNLYLIDNCVDTQKTYNAACDLLGNIPMITIATTH